MNLGNSLQNHFECTGEISSAHTAALTFQKSATSIGHPFARLTAAQRWAQLSITHDLPHPLKAYGVAVDLVSEIVGLDCTIEQRHAYLIEISSLTMSAASAAFSLGDVKKALEWLEQGRCLVWSQINQLRSPLDRLRAHDEDLAQRFSNISGTLEAFGTRRGSRGIGIDAVLSEKISLQDEAHLHIKVSREWSQLLNEIRHIPQFHNFLRPPQTSDLLKNLPRDGTVILINVHEARCDALALIFGYNVPIHIPLADFTHKEASGLKQRLLKLLSSHKVRLREADRGPRPVIEDGAESQSDIYSILGTLWLRVARPILDGLAISVSVS